MCAVRLIADENVCCVLCFTILVYVIPLCIWYTSIFVFIDLSVDNIIQEYPFVLKLLPIPVIPISRSLLKYSVSMQIQRQHEIAFEHRRARTCLELFRIQSSMYFECKINRIG